MKLEQQEIVECIQQARKRVWCPRHKARKDERGQCERCVLEAQKSMELDSSIQALLKQLKRDRMTEYERHLENRRVMGIAS